MKVTKLAEPPLPTDRCVLVWFGEHVIAEYAAEPGDRSGEAPGAELS